MHDSWDPSSNTMLATDFGRRARGSTSMRHRAIEVSKNEFLDPLERSTKHFKYCMIVWGFGATSPQNDTSIYVPYNDTLLDSSGTRQNTQRLREPPYQNACCCPSRSLATMGCQKPVEESSPKSRRESYARSSLHAREPRPNLEKRYRGPRRNRGWGSTGASRISATPRWALNREMTSGEATRKGGWPGSVKMGSSELISQWRVGLQRVESCTVP
ncbi:hypothetical protein V8E55_001021 [Tylopilus felleus]